jgi:F0F1-type ATP synthase membrane subunit a
MTLSFFIFFHNKLCFNIYSNCIKGNKLPRRKQRVINSPAFALIPFIFMSNPLPISQHQGKKAVRRIYYTKGFIIELSLALS